MSGDAFHPPHTVANSPGQCLPAQATATKTYSANSKARIGVLGASGYTGADVSWERACASACDDLYLSKKGGASFDTPDPSLELFDGPPSPRG